LSFFDDHFFKIVPNLNAFLKTKKENSRMLAAAIWRINRRFEIFPVTKPCCALIQPIFVA
jgi:hypothetical protein